MPLTKCIRLPSVHPRLFSQCASNTALRRRPHRATRVDRVDHHFPTRGGALDRTRGPDPLPLHISKYSVSLLCRRLRFKSRRKKRPFLTVLARALQKLTTPELFGRLEPNDKASKAAPRTPLRQQHVQYGPATRGVVRQPAVFRSRHC